MKRDSGVIIYAGVNFVVTPSINLEINNRYDFQRQLEETGINLSNIVFDNQTFVATRSAPSPLEIRIAVLAPQLSQIVVVAPQLNNRTAEFLAQESCDVIEVFKRVWPNRQIVASDTSIRTLFESSYTHAFQELWEGYLKQTSDNLSVFNRPVLGGGLRFVMPAMGNDPAVPTIDLKIESFLQDTKRIFVEVQSQWGQPQGFNFDPDKKLEFVENFIRNEVMDFIQKGG